ncbi:MAG: methyl-accepting chemotaxis protein, partial [Pseudomonadota bacterium]|nr:methyl-accepting chemotaxis protein [Pseudomonadota bacterium]
MQKYLQTLTIKQKMRLGFGVIWTVLAIITIQAVVNLYVVRQNVSEVVLEKQPIAIGTAEVALTLEKGVKSLNLYISTNEPAALSSYQQSYDLVFESVQASLNDLSNRGQLSSELGEQYQKIHLDLQNLPNLIDRVVDLQADRSKKFPAFEYVNEHMLSIANQFLHETGLMIDSELADLSAEREPVLRDLVALQKNWLSVIS